MLGTSGASRLPKFSTLKSQMLRIRDLGRTEALRALSAPGKIKEPGGKASSPSRFFYFSWGAELNNVITYAP